MPSKPARKAARAAIKKGIVRDPAVHAVVCADIATFLSGVGWRLTGTIPSPIRGGDGNRFKAEVEQTSFLGELVHVRVKAGEDKTPLLLSGLPQAVGRLHAGDQITLSVPKEQVVVLKEQTS